MEFFDVSYDDGLIDQIADTFSTPSSRINFLQLYHSMKDQIADNYSMVELTTDSSVFN